MQRNQMLKKVIPKLKILVSRSSLISWQAAETIIAFLYIHGQDKSEHSLLLLASDSCPTLPSSGKRVPKEQTYLTSSVLPPACPVNFVETILQTDRNLST